MTSVLRGAARAAQRLRADRRCQLRFLRAERLPDATPPSVTFDLDIPDCTGNHNRTITVNLQGRGAVANAACD